MRVGLGKEKQVVSGRGLVGLGQAELEAPLGDQSGVSEQLTERPGAQRRGLRPEASRGRRHLSHGNSPARGAPPSFYP